MLYCWHTISFSCILVSQLPAAYAHARAHIHCTMLHTFDQSRARNIKWWREGARLAGRRRFVWNERQENEMTWSMYADATPGALQVWIGQWNWRRTTTRSCHSASPFHCRNTGGLRVPLSLSQIQILSCDPGTPIHLVEQTIDLNFS